MMDAQIHQVTNENKMRIVDVSAERKTAGSGFFPSRRPPFGFLPLWSA
jgi:hypothetical protein